MLIENHQKNKKFSKNPAGAGQRNVNAEVLRKTERGFINILRVLVSFQS